jgi:hypothetical protein
MMIRISATIGLLLLLGAQGLAQQLMGEAKWKNFSTEPPWIYPYESLEWGSSHIYKTHDPLIRTGEGEFVCIWRPERRASEMRLLRKYNLFAEEQWEREVELAHNEDIVHSYVLGDTLYLLCGGYQFAGNIHTLRARAFSLKDGSPLFERDLWLYPGRDNEPLIWEVSPGGERILAWHFTRSRQPHRIRVYSDYVRQQDQVPGFKAAQAEGLLFRVWDQRLSLRAEGTVALEGPRCTWFDGQIDGQGRIYFSGYEKKRGLLALRYDPLRQERRLLAWDGLSDPLDFRDIYQALTPPSLGQDGRLYLAVSERKALGPFRGLRQWQLPCFDFDAGAMDLSRRVEIQAGVIVQVEKAREQAGLRPQGRLEYYLPVRLFETSSRWTWLITQRYSRSERNHYSDPAAHRAQIEQRAGEVVFFGFDPAGRFARLLVLPTEHHSMIFYEQLCLMADIQPGQADSILHVLTREPSGEGFRGNERIFHRQVNLSSGEISPRLAVYEGRRRDQYFLPAYVEWLNDDILSLLLIDSEHSDPLLLTINLAQEPEAPEKHRARREPD